jgi:hypothetical protein
LCPFHSTKISINLLHSFKNAIELLSSDALQATITALYCKILVILGLAFPMAEVISENVPKGYYQVS